MSLRNFLELIMIAILWGASFLFLRIATPEFGAIVLIEIRVLVASLFLLPIWFLKDKQATQGLVVERWWPLLVVAVLNSAVPFVLFAYSTLHITGGFASILNATVPIWGAIVAWLWLRKSLNRSALIGLVLGLFGVVVLVSSSITLSFNGPSIGIYSALLAALLYAIAANYTSEKLSNVTPLTISTFTQVWATLILLPLAIFYYPQHEISARAWFSVLALGVFCTGMATTLYFRLISNIGSTKAVTVTFLIPVFGSIWGALFIGEVITMEMIIGTAIILSGTALVTGLLTLPHFRARTK